MRIVLAKTQEEAIEITVAHIFNQVAEKPESVLGLATGKTMEPVYELWVKAAKGQRRDFGACSFFMLDEYQGVSADHQSSFRRYILDRLILPMNLSKELLTFPPETLKEVLDFETSITAAGGIDLQLLGIGQNGHIGFNEPGSNKESRTRIVELTPETQAANQAGFPVGKVPTRAMSMGIATILEAKRLLMLATGKSKAQTIKYLLNHHDDPSCPATYLKNHGDFTVVLDPEAASAINLKI